jgi:hypothetical protein
MSQLTRRRLLRGASFMLPVLATGRAFAAGDQPRRETDFLALGDFTINLPAEGRRGRYLVVSVTLETQATQSQAFRDILPLLRQATLRRLMEMAQNRMLQPGQADTATLREDLYASLARVREDGLKDVVITRLLHS